MWRFNGRLICQGVFMAVIEGEVLPEHASQTVSKILRSYYREYPILGAPTSLDYPYSKTGCPRSTT